MKNLTGHKKSRAMTARLVISAFKSRAPVSCAHALTMWAAAAKCEGTCESNVRSLHWQESSDGQGGWLASGCDGGTVGVSWVGNRTSEVAASDPEDSVACTDEACFYKSHFILKGHIGEVHLVRWMPTGDQLATYDSWGKIVIWKNRANILAYFHQIRTPLTVTDMQWSPCGFYLLVCGKHGNIQMFSSVNGMTLLSLQLQTSSQFGTRADFTCCMWNQPITRVALGTQTGELVILDPDNGGRSISSVSLKKGIPIHSIQWYGAVRKCHTSTGASYNSQSLSAYLRNGIVILFSSINSQKCIYSETDVLDGIVAWNPSSTMLAVVGYSKQDSFPLICFINQQGYTVFTLHNALPHIPQPQAPIFSMVWGLRGSALFISQGPNVHSVMIQEGLPSLQSLCRKIILEDLVGGNEKVVENLPLPFREVKRLNELRAPTIVAPYVNNGPSCQEALLVPLSLDQCMHCILEPSGHDTYILKYEFLNQYIPLLQARKKCRKASSLLTSGYEILPAFKCISSSSSACYWASHPFQTQSPEFQLSPRRFSKERSRSLFKQLRSAIRPGHSHAVMDAPQQDLSHASPLEAHSEDSGPLVLAEVERTIPGSLYKLSTTSPLFEDGILGTVNVSTHYLMCKPRKLDIVLSTVRRGEDGDCLGVETVVLQSKDPHWNRWFQIFELDFGGRVTKDSTKNIQVENNGRVVLQFGRSDKNCFCLDFQAPFSPIQALCVGLTCIL